MATAFSWERHGSWIGPEYFPPFGGERNYRDLSRELARHGDHLQVYLYHEYQLGYAGWIDRGFSPMADERIGLGRAFIFGMQPGVRINSGNFRLDAEPTFEMQMLARAMRLLRKTEDYLLLGRMLHDPAVLDSPTMPSAEKPVAGHPPLPISWPVVQATTWRSPRGHVGYAIANLGDQSQAIRLVAEPNGMTADTFTLTRLDPHDATCLHHAVALPKQIPLTLQPWELCCIEQTPGP